MTCILHTIFDRYVSKCPLNSPRPVAHSMLSWMALDCHTAVPGWYSMHKQLVAGACDRVGMCCWVSFFLVHMRQWSLWHVLHSWPACACFRPIWISLLHSFKQNTWSLNTNFVITGDKSCVCLSCGHSLCWKTQNATECCCIPFSRISWCHKSNT